MTTVNTIFFDIDGTIYDGKEGCIPPSAIKALQKIQSKGIKIFLATGRSLPAVLKSNLDNEIIWDGYVCSNGACIHDKNKVLIAGSFFTETQLQAIFELAHNTNVALAIQSDQIVFSPFGINEHMIEAFRFFNNPVPDAKPYEKEPIAMVLAFQLKGFDYHIFDSIPNVITVEGKANYADVMQKGITKATGIRKLRQMMQLEDGLIMSFGDADNDLEMILDADIGVAMGNATETIKQAADHITTDITNDGVYNALLHFNLI